MEELASVGLAREVKERRRREKKRRESLFLRLRHFPFPSFPAPYRRRKHGTRKDAAGAR
jgi:hypothetical protein